MDLLLLPALSPPIKRSSWWAAYKSTVEQALRRVRPSDKIGIKRLDVAVVLTPSFTPITSRTAFFPLFQSLLREVYSLICASAVEVQVDLDFPSGVDARVFFVELTEPDTPSGLLGKQALFGPVVSAHTFVTAKRPYQAIYSVESEAGEGALRTLLRLWRNNGIAPDVQRLSCGTSMTASDGEPHRDVANSTNRSHRSVIGAGTFDHLHIGHKLLIAATVYLSEPDQGVSSSRRRKIAFGITGDELLVNKKHGELVESWEERQQRTADFVDSMLIFHPDIASLRTVQSTERPGPNGKVVKIVYGNEVEVIYTRISDPFGPTITDEDISAIIVSAETRAGGKAVNDKRREMDWHVLDVFEVAVLDTRVDEDDSRAAEAESFASKISSTEIRRRLEARTRSTNGHL